MLAAPGAVITLPGRPAWARDWVSDASASFFIIGATPAKDAAPASAGAELRFVKVRALLAKLEGEFAGREQNRQNSGIGQHHCHLCNLTATISLKSG